MSFEIYSEEKTRLTPKEAAQTALDMQGACNLGGVTRALHEIFRAYVLKGTAANTSAPMRLAMHQAAYLATGHELLDPDEYSAAAVECEALAKGEP